MQEDTWLAKERRRDIHMILLTYFDCHTSDPTVLFGKLAPIMRLGGGMRNPQIRELAMETGLSAEELVRFHLWMTEIVMNRLLYKDDLLDRMSQPTAENIVSRALGLRRLPEDNDIVEWHGIAGTLSDIFGSEEETERIAKQIGVDTASLTDAGFLMFRQYISKMRDLAMRGPLLPDSGETLMRKIFAIPEPPSAADVP